MFLFDSAIATKDWPGLENHVQDILGKNGAEIQYSEKWPDRKLAYEVKGCKKGTYFLTYFNAAPTSIREIERDFKLSERVLRVLIIQDKGLEKEMERRKKREVTAPPPDVSPEEEKAESREARRRPEIPDDKESSLKEDDTREPEKAPELESKKTEPDQADSPPENGSPLEQSGEEKP
jgi:small subunit ribosomal protein S6